MSVDFATFPRFEMQNGKKLIFVENILIQSRWDSEEPKRPVSLSLFFLLACVLTVQPIFVSIQLDAFHSEIQLKKQTREDTKTIKKEVLNYRFLTLIIWNNDRTYILIQPYTPTPSKTWVTVIYYAKMKYTIRWRLSHKQSLHWYLT